MAWSHDDPLIQVHIFKELCEALPSGRRLEYKKGGHNLQKTQAEDVTKNLHDWIRNDLKLQ